MKARLIMLGGSVVMEIFDYNVDTKEHDISVHDICFQIDETVQHRILNVLKFNHLSVFKSTAETFPFTQNYCENQ